MGKRILVIQGHPDTGALHFNHALAQAYTDGAREAGHSVTVVDVAGLDFPLLRSQAAWQAHSLPASLRPAQQPTSRLAAHPAKTPPRMARTCSVLP